MTVLSHRIEPSLIGARLHKEISAILKLFNLKEFQLNQVVDRLHVSIVGCLGYLEVLEPSGLHRSNEI